MPENRDTGRFSAVGFYFALELHNALGVPVGIVGAYWGGTPIAPWTPKEGLASVDATRKLAERILLDRKAFQKKIDEAKARGEPLPHFHGQPSVIYNAEVAPFAPMAMRGFLWYQGETDNWRGLQYAPCLHALYNGWAKAFENPDLRMRIVQLVPAGGSSLALTAEAQAIFVKEEKNAKLTVACDRGAVYDWHPTDKETVGMRLAALALRHDYGFSEIKADAPAMTSWKIDGPKFVLSFENVDEWHLYNEDWSSTNNFEIAGSDGKWHPAVIDNLRIKETKPNESDGRIQGRDLTVFSPDVDAPKKLRHLYRRPFKANLFNEAGLPLGPLHVDVK